MNRQDRSLLRQFARFMPLALLLPVSIFVGYGIGFGLDRLLGTNFLYLVFLLLGIASGMVTLVREVTRENGDG